MSDNGTEQHTKSDYDAFGVTTFVWDGNRLLSESGGGRSHLWIYEDDRFAPLAQSCLRRGEIVHYAKI
ncbi:hypothetical protein [Cronobacter sakazakii]|uniref:hypothetical protein n=2 Tax=Cronobacter sakazakii TaxID=28141 RepID=UPI00029C448B|nr:hypothetical protein [Cronobacter sakazakii]CCK12545.1 Rhs-family protein [Cronobacter sakazakii 680]AKE93811.1 hypothetical protein CSK29544_00848 [Cronobacter sakazakii]EIZ9238923.1 Rhs-family protein [Cronobacter sakazakii]EJC8212534.1 Rhs-family protein [Cronobacter sakazakii]ELY4315699.1 Rhs-family protein [Cronobacter sakazakii]